MSLETSGFDSGLSSFDQPNHDLGREIDRARLDLDLDLDPGLADLSSSGIGSGDGNLKSCLACVSVNIDALLCAAVCSCVLYVFCSAGIASTREAKLVRAVSEMGGMWNASTDVTRCMISACATSTVDLRLNFCNFFLDLSLDCVGEIGTLVAESSLGICPFVLGCRCGSDIVEVKAEIDSI